MFKRILQRPADAHLLEIVGELFAAIEAHHIGRPLGDASFAHWRHRPCQAAMGAAEQKIENRINH